MTNTNAAASDIVSKLWSLCHLLRDDGVTYHEYVNELTFLLFLKMMQETSQEDCLVVFKAPRKGASKQLQTGMRWSDLMHAQAPDRLNVYKSLLLDYSRNGSGTVQEIYSNAHTVISKPSTLSKLVDEIDKLAWYSVHREDLGDLYEGLLARNANEKKSGAGQYFTPRALVDSIVRVMRPELDDVIQDPAAGTAGFLIAANHYLRRNNDIESLTQEQSLKYRRNTFYGMELVQDAHRLALMNMLLHGIEGGVRAGDTLGVEGAKLPSATLILSNPPFGTKKGGGLPARDDLAFPTTNKQLCFLQHIYQGLEVGGRAAVVLPDNVLFDSNVGVEIRRDLMEKCNLHTILRLPTGIFYAQGVKTNVLFFTRGISDTANTKDVWVYDLRANIPQFGKRTLLTQEYFSDFEIAFGNDPLGRPENTVNRKDTGEEGRFRKFTREWISARGENLDIAWLKDDGDGLSYEFLEPGDLARDAMAELDGALEELRGILAELGEDVEELEI
ncbi:N-6 DNA methylase [Pseudomonas sp.]|uniref:N-6 DNA methylase n=1 Tax=Pseudomonas sp. TaxID=306 RepID=UPI0032656CA0